MFTANLPSPGAEPDPYPYQPFDGPPSEASLFRRGGQHAYGLHTHTYDEAGEGDRRETKPASDQRGLIKQKRLISLAQIKLTLRPFLPANTSLASTSAKRPYTDARMWLNLVIKACFNQSTAISDTITKKTG